MPVLIKSMTMPKSCIHCRFSRSKKYIFVCEITDIAYLPEEAGTRPSACPLTDGKETVKGRWLYELADNGWADHICSVCGWTMNTDVHVSLGYDYCPMCGADMRCVVDDKLTHCMSIPELPQGD